MKHLNYFLLTVCSLVLLACNDKYPDLKDGIYAEFVTNKGTAVAELKFQDTPLTVANFVSFSFGFDFVPLPLQFLFPYFHALV